MLLKLAEEHGGNIHRASEILNMEMYDILDFSANISPLGIPEALKEIILSNMETLTHYPDPEYYRLRSRLSDYTGLPSCNIIPGNGSSEIIFLLLKVLRPGNILIPAPSFSEYEKAAIDAGIGITLFELKEDDDFRLNIKSLKDEISAGTDCVMLCNPNNPTSTLISYEGMKLVIEHASRYKTTVIIDEAFIELTTGGTSNSMATLVKDYDNLFIIRAFTKVFAVPGLRLGYGMGNEKLVEQMRSKQQPWSVNALAACAGEFIPGAGEYLQRIKAWLVQEKEWLFERLKEIASVKVFQPETNFILVKLPDTGPDSATLKERMAKKGVLIRDASNFRFLNNRFIRVAVRDRESNKRLIEVLKEELDQVGSK
jgi:threonine-phosphate decarboxylase